jgi:hypothetical protein
MWPGSSSRIEGRRWSEISELNLRAIAILVASCCASECQCLLFCSALCASICSAHGCAHRCVQHRFRGRQFCGVACDGAQKLRQTPRAFSTPTTGACSLERRAELLAVFARPKHIAPVNRHTSTHLCIGALTRNLFVLPAEMQHVRSVLCYVGAHLVSLPIAVCSQYFDLLIDSTHSVLFRPVRMVLHARACAWVGSASSVTCLYVPGTRSCRRQSATIAQPAIECGSLTPASHLQG